MTTPSGTSAYRLPETVRPKAYAVDLDATPRRKGFRGTVIMTLKVLKATETVECHARGLKVSAPVAKVKGKRHQKNPGKVAYHADRETMVVTFDKPLPKGEVVLSMDFAGQLNPSMHGLYLAKDGPEKAIVSQCEATDARAIFPCFDEPEFKASLQWTIRTDPGLTVITNGVAKGRRKTNTDPVRVVHKFEPTRIIPTYLAAVTIGKFDSSAEIKVRGIPCRSWAGVGKSQQLDFAQEVTAQVLPWYERYFGQKYNYQKLDQVAVPGFDAGAMENVGAIFYRQTLLLMDPKTTSWMGQKRIAEVIAHEIAHQWFGNLVTMKWWDDLWLNEAFATWIAYKACDAWKPDWRIWDDYLESKEDALGADALVNTHPIYTPVKSPAEATEMFDVITYEKGCAVLRMAESYLGDEAFRAGIQLYQKAFKNKNAAGADLWNSLAQASSEPVDALMQSWIRQPGFPLIHVSSSSDGKQMLLHVRQQRFFTNAALMAQEDDSQRWMIPMVIRYGSDKGNTVRTHRVILDTAERTIKLPASAKASWVFPNDNAGGFFRMHFEPEALRALLHHGIQHLSPGALLSLIEDQWALVRAGLTGIGQFMDVLEALGDVRDHIVARAVVGRLSYISDYLVKDAVQPLWRRFVAELLGPQLDELAWQASDAESESQADAVRRAAVVHGLGDLARDEAVLQQAQDYIAQEMQDPASVEANLAAVLPTLGALMGDSNVLQRYTNEYLKRKKAGTTPQLQARYLGAFSAFEDKAASDQVMAMCLEAKVIPQEQLRTVLTPMLRRKPIQLRTWAFLKKHWETLSPKVGTMGIARLVEATGALPTELKEDVAGFFAANPVEEAQRAVQKSLEAMSLREELCSRETEALSKWLQNRNGARRRRSA